VLRNVLEEIVSPNTTFGEKCTAVLMILMMTAAMAIVGWTVFYISDSAGIKSNDTVITVVDNKWTIPAYTSTTLVGKVVVPQYHPESNQLRFYINGTSVAPAVDKKLFDEVRIGDSIKVEYGLGRFSNSYHPKKIEVVRK
jgi:hypothetical protein